EPSPPLSPGSRHPCQADQHGKGGGSPVKAAAMVPHGCGCLLSLRTNLRLFVGGSGTFLDTLTFTHGHSFHPLSGSGLRYSRRALPSASRRQAMPRSASEIRPGAAEPAAAFQPAGSGLRSIFAGANYIRMTSELRAGK